MPQMNENMGQHEHGSEDLWENKRGVPLPAPSHEVTARRAATTLYPASCSTCSASSSCSCGRASI